MFNLHISHQFNFKFLVSKQNTEFRDIQLLVKNFKVFLDLFDSVQSNYKKYLKVLKTIHMPIPTD